MTRPRLVAAVLVALPLLAYPAVTIADGGVRLPSRADCVRIAPEGTSERLDLVFGRRSTVAEADALREQVAGVGYVDAEVQGDSCGRWKVLYDGIESFTQGEESRAEARGAGLEAELELEES